MKYPIHLFIMISLLWVGGCASVLAQPDWMAKPPRASSLYMYGIGIAHATGDQVSDRQRADDAARTDIARQLRVTINASLTTTTSENTEVGITYDTKQVIESSVSITLDGVDINKRHYDKKHKTYYALARLNRQNAAERFSHDIQSAAQRAAGFLNQARRHQMEGATYRMFLTLWQAARERASVGVEESMYRVLASNSVDGLLGGVGLGSDFKPDHAEIEQMMNSMVANMSFEKIAGDGQSIFRGQLREPLSARLTTRWEEHTIPVAGFPVRFDITQGHGKLEQRGTSGTDGMIQSTVNRMLPGGEPFSEVVASIDTAAIRAQAPAGPSANWLNRLGEVQARYRLTPGEFGFEDGIGELAFRLRRRLPEDLSMVVGRFTYQDTRIAGPFTGPLRRFMKKEISALVPGRLIEQVRLSAGTTAYGDPETVETFARSARANAVIWGDYWERGDSILVAARLTGSDGTRLASAQIFIPRAAVALYTIRPPTLDPDLPAPPVKGIPIHIWTDRGDGALYVEGDRLAIFVQSESDCYLRLLYRQVDGTIIQIFPNSLSGDERVTADQVYAIPDAEAAYDFVVQPPFGVEYLVAIASSTPFASPSGREINGGVLLRGTMTDVVKRLTRNNAWYGQAMLRMTTIAQ